MITITYTSKNIYDYSKTNDINNLIIALDNKNNDDDWYRDELGFTAVNIAAMNNYSDCVRILISYGADVNSKSRNGFTALNWFVDIGHVEMVELLISNGADINNTSALGDTPLTCLLYTSPSPRDRTRSRMPSSA